MLTDNTCQPIAIGHLSDSCDLKILIYRYNYKKKFENQTFFLMEYDLALVRFLKEAWMTCVFITTNYQVFIIRWYKREINEKNQHYFIQSAQSSTDSEMTICVANRKTISSSSTRFTHVKDSRHLLSVDNTSNKWVDKCLISCRHRTVWTHDDTLVLFIQ